MENKLQSRWDRRLRALVNALVLVVAVIHGGGGQAQQSSEKLVDRLATAIDSKEPTFKLAAKIAARAQDPSNTIGWNDRETPDQYVSVVFHECASVEEATERLRLQINSPTAVISPTSKLEQLGDEAYIREHTLYAKPGSTSLFFRQGRVVVILRASSRSSAERFARHIVEEIDKR